MDAQSQAQRLLDDLIERDIERGLQVAAYHDGRLVVDAWAGVADAATGRPVDGDTLFTVFSVGKGPTATIIHLLAERGRLAYDDPISRYWPEFAAHGKASITIRQALAHTAGIPHLPDGTGPADLVDWERQVAGIAALAPLWEPGTRTGYHAITFGFILGEVAQRVAGRPFGDLVQAEIAAPLGVPLYFGLPDDLAGEVAPLEDRQPMAGASSPPSLRERAVPLAIQPLGPVFNQAAVRRACIPAAGAIATARAVARHYAALVGDGVDGRRLLPPSRVAEASAVQTAADDMVLGRPLPKGLGYWLGEPLSAMSERVSVFGHPGGGGSIGFADPDARFAFGLTKSRLLTSRPGESTAALVARTVRAALGIPER
jgi:CubicO group peptidase (beta-lactamase class C family)